MRNFEQRKAEIFRRSEERIKMRRKNRKRILSLCIPFFLCVTIFSVIYLPDILTSADKNNFTADMGSSDIADGEAPFEYYCVEIKNQGTSSESGKTVMDISDVENIYGIIQSYFLPKEEAGDDAYVQYNTSENGTVGSKDDGESKKENYSAFSSSEKKNHATKGTAITISFTANNQTKREYTLKGNKITDTLTKNEVVLTNNQLSELQKALGLTS